MASPELRAFIASGRAWHGARKDVHARRLLRSPFSGVPQDIAAAYVTVAARDGSLIEALSRERLAVETPARDLLFAFRAKLGRIAETDAGEVATVMEQEFDLTIEDSTVPRARNGSAVLAEAVAPEIGAGLKSHHSHFSASSLNTYAECARKWYYRYMCAAVEDRGSSASFYGTAFHAALEALHGEFPHPSDAAPEDLARKLEGYVNASFDRFKNQFGTAVEYELQRRRAQRTAKRYVEWIVAEARRSPFTVIGNELGAQLDLEGFNFIGYIDRLDRDDRSGNVAVIDYKTGSIATTAAEYREKVREFKDFQLPFYYWARTAEGDRVTRLALVPLKDALLDVRPVALEVVPVSAPDGRRSASPTGVISVGELERARTRMIEICRELCSGDITLFPATDDPAACTYCVYKTACLLRPPPAQEKFGR
ncbi:MAG: PD-(D/E)XK nuclease family protein [Candidatus Eremiobacteraeota bacterium]|nr:PD-(D/E)XK nuclease family protein [Candidatus Eremiobacteraeota bacterium]